jgi:lipopolysaccharide biosynthesis regulator YciM
MLELLAFLLPIAAASGWYAARRHYTKKYLSDHGKPLTRAYYRGLNYLLNEKTDKAIDVFAGLLETDLDTVETHIALGNLFRKRGEVEKAIEVHERLLNAPNLNDEQRSSAYFELGMDYMRAGLLDRAESIFKTLAAKNPNYRKPALHQLLQIYQQEKDWQSAIDCTAELIRLFGVTPRGENEAQFLCEMADEARAAGNLAHAKEYVARSLIADRNCVRASLIKAQLELGEELYGEALHTLKSIETQQPHYLSEIVQLVGFCYERLGVHEERVAYLQYLYEKYSLVDAAIGLAEFVRDTDGAGRAVEYLLGVLEVKPCLRGISGLVGLLANIEAGNNARLLEKVSRILAKLWMENPRYNCVQCGFSGSELHWRCPSCQYWGSVRPL